MTSRGGRSCGAEYSRIPFRNSTFENTERCQRSPPRGPISARARLADIACRVLFEGLGEWVDRGCAAGRNHHATRHVPRTQHAPEPRVPEFVAFLLATTKCAARLQRRVKQRDEVMLRANEAPDVHALQVGETPVIGSLSPREFLVFASTSISRPKHLRSGKIH